MNQEDGNQNKVKVVIDEPSFTLKIREYTKTTRKFLDIISNDIWCEPKAAAISLPSPLPLTDAPKDSKEAARKLAEVFNNGPMNQMPIFPVYDTPEGRSIDGSTIDDIMQDGGGEDG